MERQDNPEDFFSESLFMPDSRQTPLEDKVKVRIRHNPGGYSEQESNVRGVVAEELYGMSLQSSSNLPIDCNVLAVEGGRSDGTSPGVDFAIIHPPHQGQKNQKGLPPAEAIDWIQIKALTGEHELRNMNANSNEKEMRADAYLSAVGKHSKDAANAAKWLMDNNAAAFKALVRRVNEAGMQLPEKYNDVLEAVEAGKYTIAENRLVGLIDQDLTYPIPSDLYNETVTRSKGKLDKHMSAAPYTVSDVNQLSKPLFSSAQVIRDQAISQKVQAVQEEAENLSVQQRILLKKQELLRVQQNLDQLSGTKQNAKIRALKQDIQLLTAQSKKDKELEDDTPSKPKTKRINKTKNRHNDIE